MPGHTLLMRIEVTEFTAFLCTGSYFFLRDFL